MNKKTKLIYDLICYYKRMTVNRQGTLSTAKSKELKYLIKKNLISMKRLPGSFSKTRYSVVVPVEERNLEHIFCPDCKNKLPVKEGILYFNSFNIDYHKYNCSLRIDHYRDSYFFSNKKRIFDKL